MRKSVIIVVICCLGALLFAVVANWPGIKHAIDVKFKNQVSEASEIQRSELLFKEGDVEGALKIIHDHEDALDYHTDIGKKWVDLLINISGATRNASQVITLYDNFPQAFEGNEKSSLKAADAFIIGYRPKDYEKLREKWQGKEGRPHDWLVLDADLLILNNQRPEAAKLLNSRSFDGPNDTGRLVRLALLSLPGDNQAAWDYLTTAQAKDPTNPDIHTYRARLLESVGKKPLALSEYVAAVQTAPKNIFLKDQLAEFYLRNNEYNQAMSIWHDILLTTPYEPIWVKTLFWNHVIRPVPYDWKSMPVAKGELQPLIEYLIALPADRFWDESAFDAISNGQRFLTSQQATYWLRLLEDLKNGKEDAALELMQFNPFKQVSWNPELEMALRRVLSYRKNGTLSLSEMSKSLDQATDKNSNSTQLAASSNFFFAQLDQLAKQPDVDGKSAPLPEGLRALLLSKEALAVTLLSTGWFEAALQLHTIKVLPADFPEWVAIAFTQALKVNRSNEEALAFAAAQKPSEPLSLLIGELLATTKQTDAAIEKLQKMAVEPSEIGMRAAWLVGLIYIERGDYALAEKTIDAQPLLAKDNLGKEMKARIALLKGDEPLAAQIYTSIEGSSSEAKSYLASKAYAAKDWAKAKQLTEELLKLYPDNALLYENLKKINEEQQSVQKTDKPAPFK